MKAKLLCVTALSGIALCSCVRYTPRVPDMPYIPGKHTTSSPAVWGTPPAAPATPAATAPAKPATPAAPAKPAAPAPAKPAATPPAKPAATPAKPAPAKPAAIPAPRKVDPAKPLDLTKPIKPAPKVEPKAAPAPAPVNDPAPEPAKKITNEGGKIPTAMRVEGDPTRVYNPLDPSKTIRIIDKKTGQPYPSGKELKVRNTDYHFYVP